MSQRISIVDYGMGNLRSVQKALQHVAPEARVEVTSDAQAIRDSDRVVFPGLTGLVPDKDRGDGFDESELLPFGVDVIVVAPGAVATPIWSKAEEQDITPYANTVYADALKRLQSYMLGLGAKGLAPEKLGEVIHNALTTPKPKVRYTVSPEPFQVFMSERVLSKRALDRIVGKRLGLLPE